MNRKKYAVFSLAEKYMLLGQVRSGSGQCSVTGEGECVMDYRSMHQVREVKKYPHSDGEKM